MSNGRSHRRRVRPDYKPGEDGELSVRVDLVPSMVALGSGAVQGDEAQLLVHLLRGAFPDFPDSPDIISQARRLWEAGALTFLALKSGDSQCPWCSAKVFRSGPTVRLDGPDRGWNCEVCEGGFRSATGTWAPGRLAR